jgi:hypothetical protein
LSANNYQEWKHHVDAALYLSGSKKYVEKDIKFTDVSANPAEAIIFINAFTLLDNNLSIDIWQNLGSIEPYLPFHLYKAITELFEPKSAASRLQN